jgi:hypothetical protein
VVTSGVSIGHVAFLGEEPSYMIAIWFCYNWILPAKQNNNLLIEERFICSLNKISYSNILRLSC